MAELEIDQTNLPRVQEVCQCFAVLEDGALAHNLQEQEIEQYYTTNIQKNQLVQKDIRVAKKLQDEEEEQWAQQTALFRQASKQLEEQDFEYARLIQEEILRSAEVAQRREQDDEEMARHIHEGEKQRLRWRNRGQEGASDGSVSDPAMPSPHQHTLSSLRHGEEQYSITSTRWQCSTSYQFSNLTGPKVGSGSGIASHKNTTSWSNERNTDSFRKLRSEFKEPLSEDSEDSDTVFSEGHSLSQRVNERLNTSPLIRASLHHPHERKYRSLCSHRSFTDEQERGEWEEDQSENRDLDKRRPGNWRQERNRRLEYEDLHRNGGLDRNSRLAEVRERRCSHSESVRLHDRSRPDNRALARTWSYNSDKHVRFQDDNRSVNKQSVQSSSSVWEMLGQVLKERGVPVRIGSNGASLQILRPQSRDSQVLHGSEVSCSDSQPHQRVFQRASSTRHSFHGDIREKKRLSYRESSGRDHREDGGRHNNVAEHDGEVYEISTGDSCLSSRERGGSRRWKEHKYTKDHMRERNVNDCRVKRPTDECRHWQEIVEERLSTDGNEEAEMRRDQHHRRAPRRSQSLSSSGRASTRDKSRHLAAGASLEPEPDEARLDLGELHQVLEDEELARKLQEEEDKLLRRTSQPSPSSSHPERDFRAAQVAQDEEIAHFMQKQEIKSKRRSRELEGPASWREHRAMISRHDGGVARDTQVPRERLDSEGLPSPVEDCSPENQPPSPTSAVLQTQHIRNVAEELDPTFQARRQITESLQAGQTGSSPQAVPKQNSGLHDFLEEPTFIPPTKRQADKSGRSKPKEKKENCKQQ